MEGAGIIQALLSLVFVAALIGLMGWGLRRWGASRFAEKMQEGRRLRMIEQLYLDPKHKLVLVQCDAREYLVMMGPQSEQLVALAEAKKLPAKKKEEKDEAA